MGRLHLYVDPIFFLLQPSSLSCGVVRVRTSTYIIVNKNWNLFSRKPQRQKKASELDAEVGIVAGASAGAAAAPAAAKKVEKPEVCSSMFSILVINRGIISNFSLAAAHSYSSLFGEIDSLERVTHKPAFWNHFYLLPHFCFLQFLIRFNSSFK